MTAVGEAEIFPQILCSRQVIELSPSVAMNINIEICNSLRLKAQFISSFVSGIVAKSFNQKRSVIEKIVSWLLGCILYICEFVNLCIFAFVRISMKRENLLLVFIGVFVWIWEAGDS